MRKRIYLDFETYSDLDLKKVGMYKYMNHSSFTVWCAAYAVDDAPVQLITDINYLATILPGAKIYAHNAEFEWYTLKKLGYDISLKDMIDTQGLASLFGYPLGLNNFCKALNLPVLKDAKGTRLINKLCKPQKKTIKNPSGRWYPSTAPKDFQDLYDYCKQDVEVMRMAVKRLPMEELPPLEQYVWGHTVMQNARGIKIDTEAVGAIIRALTEFKKQGERELWVATDGSVQTAKQLDKMKKWLNDWGLNVTDLTKGTVDQLLKESLQPECRRVLELRQQLAHSSVAKFDKMQQMVGEDGRVRGNLTYYAAHTGRFAGRGLQVHNLPRAQVKNPEGVISDFKTYAYKVLVEKYPDINATASKLIRAMIISEDGKNLIVADYSSVENVVLHWAAGDAKTTQDFENGLCQYTVYSAARLGITYDQVTKEQRTQSKPDVLGLGYGGGYRALISVAAGYGVDLKPHEAQGRVNFYRNKYKMIPRFWKTVFDKAKAAIETKDPQVLLTPTIKLEFRCAGGYLFILLPSGRRLSYPQVKLNAMWYIKVKGKKVSMSADISYMGVKSGVWMRIGTHPGMLVENIIQAVARDLLVYGLLCDEQAGYKILMSVHDEAIAEGEDETVDDFCSYLCMKPKWATIIPLRAEGYVSKRYRKD